MTSTAGRGYRSRSLDNVLAEVQQLHNEHGMKHFVFADLKLNSNLDLWRGLSRGMQHAAPGCTWIGAVHVGGTGDNGLSADDLDAAARGGCVRLTTGLESGSQRVLDGMRKGSTVARVEQFLADATRTGISTRCTMVIGHPGESAGDVAESAQFLARNRGAIERVSVNRLGVIVGTPLHRAIARKPESVPGYLITGADNVMAQVEHQDPISSTRSHRRQVMRLLGEAHRINRKHLSQRASAFEGVM